MDLNLAHPSKTVLSLPIYTTRTACQLKDGW